MLRFHSFSPREAHRKRYVIAHHPPSDEFRSRFSGKWEVERRAMRPWNTSSTCFQTGKFVLCLRVWINSAWKLVPIRVIRHLVVRFCVIPPHECIDIVLQGVCPKKHLLFDECFHYKFNNSRDTCSENKLPHAVQVRLYILHGWTVSVPKFCLPIPLYICITPLAIYMHDFIMREYLTK